MVRKRKFMDDDMWKKILHEYIMPYHMRNAFCPPTFIGHKDGEPLLNKKLPNRLSDLSFVLPGMKIDIYSHGLLLPKWRERGQDFMDFLASLPNKVRYMMSYHPYNHDGSHNDYDATIQYMQDVLRRRMQGEYSNIEFITVSHRSKWVPEGLQSAWNQLWAGLPITVHSNVNINPWTGRIEEGTVRFNGCPYGDFGHWFFGATGNVIACCLDLEEEIVLGNVMKDDPEAMFKATESFYAEQRRRQASKEYPLYAVCADCFGFRRDEVTLLQLEPMRV